MERQRLSPAEVERFADAVHQVFAEIRAEIAAARNGQENTAAQGTDRESQRPLPLFDPLPTTRS